MIRLILSVVVGFVVLSLAGAEVKSFLGVDFGTKVDGSRFTGPIENGSYTFKGPSNNPDIQYYATATPKGKRIDSVTLVHQFPVQKCEAAKKHYFKVLTERYAKHWVVVPKESKTWQKCHADWKAKLSSAGWTCDDYFMAEFKNESKEICQVLQVLVTKTKDVAVINVWVRDFKIAETDEPSCGVAKDASKKQVANTSSSNSTARQRTAQSQEKQTADEIAMRLGSFLGYTFGETYGAMENGPAGMTMFIRLDRPFRYIKEGYGYGNAQGRLMKLRLSGDFPDGMSIEGARGEVKAMADMFERKYGIKMEPTWGGGRCYCSENGQVRIAVRLDETDQEFCLEVENKRALSFGRKVEALGADVGADML